ncbi:MAG: nuclear transport factor 2 family protein [Thermoleophilaceae bacterium]|nr:nuclear transport factor 2 family protein [Thermoleophilaceae bacterium]
MADANRDRARAFFSAFNEADRERFTALLAEDVELETLTGPFAGREAAAGWLKQGRGKVVPHAVCDRFFERDGRELVLIRLQFRRRDNRELLQEADIAAVFEFAEDGLVKRCEMYQDPAEALKAIGLGG